MKFNVNSSLPRAGSELMQALLAQHPDVYASATSPLLEYCYGALGNYGLPEAKSQNPENMESAMQGFMRNGVKGYYDALTDKPTIIDKSRGWLEYAELLWDLYPDAKIVSMVRNVDGILGSLEKIYQDNIGHPETRNIPINLDQRRQYFLENVPLGLALRRLRERQRKGPDSRILYVEYEGLISQPISTMNRVFEHLELTPHEIDPNNIKKSVEEDDSFYGIFGDHKIKSSIKTQ